MKASTLQEIAGVLVTAGYSDLAEIVVGGTINVDTVVRALPKMDKKILESKINNSLDGMDLLDYMAGVYSFSDREWSRFVDGKFWDTVGKKDKASKMKVLNKAFNILNKRYGK